MHGRQTYSTTTAEFSLIEIDTSVAVAFTLVSAGTGASPGALAALSWASCAVLGLFGAPKDCQSAWTLPWVSSSTCSIAFVGSAAPAAWLTVRWTVRAVALQHVSGLPQNPRKTRRGLEPDASVALPFVVANADM